jgi:hypothetical protein
MTSNSAGVYVSFFGAFTLQRSAYKNRSVRPSLRIKQLENVMFNFLPVASMKMTAFWDMKTVKQSRYTPWRRLGEEEV